ncbi:hypothetical protein [Pseudomonas sp. COR18]|uniref:Uncharacterized protein n=1 Tax=Pseudomonas asplenii TaxID=53407 RepID=A0A0M9GC03_9PSED|nr:hypothetical protein PF66_06007 [Pseudomonas fuscovaginae]KPA97820.1 hypothetical protein PF70_02087 [Pseudomonas fuscovaginae]
MGRQSHSRPSPLSASSAAARTSALIPRRIHRHAINQRARL